MGEKGGLIRGSTSLSSDGSQPESCSGCLDPRDESTAHRLVAHRSASKKGNRQLVPNHYRNALAKNENFPLRKKHAAIPTRKERSGLREAPEKAPTAP